MEDEQSTEQAPVADPLLDALSDTEDAVETTPEVEETPEPTEDEAETTPEVEPTEEETEELQPEVDPKEEARRRYEERKQHNLERRQAINQYAAEESQKIREGAEDEYDGRLREVEARDLQRDAERYIERIEGNEAKLVNEFDRVKAHPDLQIFNPENKETFNPKAYDKAMRDYNAGYIEYDQNDNMVGIKGSLFEHLTETAELLQGAVKSGAVQQVRATRKMRSNADTKPAANPKEAPKDEIMEILKSD